MQAHVIKLLIRDYQKCHLRIPTPLNKNVKGAICFLLVMYTTDHWSCTFKHKRERPLSLSATFVGTGSGSRWSLKLNAMKQQQ